MLTLATSRRAAALFFTALGAAISPALVLGQETGQPQILPAEVIVAETLPAQDAQTDTPSTSLAPDTAATTPTAEPATPTPAAEPVVVDARTHMKAAYERTKTAINIEGYTEVIDSCEKALAAKPDEKGKAYTHQLLAWALNRRGKLYAGKATEATAEEAKQLDSAALSDFEAAVKYDPTKWQAVHNRGVSFAQLGRHQDALADFSKTIQLNPKYANAWYNRGEIYYELSDLKKALADYTEALRLNPNDSGAYSSRGHANYELGNYRDAINDYNHAVKHDRNNASAVADRADLYSNLGIWDRAARDYRTAVQMDQKLGRAYLGAAWLMATCPDQQYRDTQLAIDSAEKAIQLDGRGDYRYLDTLAAAYANAGQWDKAQATLQEAIEKAPEQRQASLKSRLELYSASQPYRDPARTASSSGEAPIR